MKLIAYLRVSSDAQVDAYGLEAQAGSVDAWCRTNGHRIVRLPSIRGFGSDGCTRSPRFSEAITALQPEMLRGWP
jgi:DNA invertase Pin-like site-specific DNA recombinase